MKPPQQGMLDFIYGLHEIQSVNQLAERICHGLTDLVDGENVIICTHDGTNKMITSVVAKHMFSKANLMPEINQTGIMAQHPFWDHVFKEGMSAQVLSDIVTRSDWHRNPFYAEVFRPDGIEDQMNFELHGTPRNFVTLNVLRGRRGFRAGDRERFQLLGRHISQAFVNARVAELSGVVGVGQNAGFRLRLTPEGVLSETVVEVPANAHFLFGENGQPLGGFRDWLARQTLRLNQGLLESNIRPLCLKSPDGVWLLTLHRDFLGCGYVLSGCLKSPGQTVVRLSPRETDVMQLVSLGMSNSEIFRTLGMGEETVKTHLKRIFRKLSVTNRTAAVKAWHKTLCEFQSD